MKWVAGFGSPMVGLSISYLRVEDGATAAVGGADDGAEGDVERVSESDYESCTEGEESSADGADAAARAAVAASAAAVAAAPAPAPASRSRSAVVGSAMFGPEEGSLDVPMDAEVCGCLDGSKLLVTPW